MQVQETGSTRQHIFGSAVALTLLLSGCGGVPLAPDSPSAQPAVIAAPAPVAQAGLPALPPAGSGRGGYYMDDGPGDSPPARLLETADAEPRIEPIGKRGNRPYVVFGKQYTPFTDDRPYKERGRGSWYGKKFHGQKTSSGEPYDMYKMTAAHTTMPLPSYARVTNVENGRQVIVRVNDRGPFIAGRIIDLSYTAALKLGYLSQGSAMLEVERLLPEEIERMAAQRAVHGAAQGAPRPQSMQTSGDAAAAQVAEVAPQELPARTELASAPVVSMPVASMAAAPASTAAQVQPVQSAAGIYLQLGAFGQAGNADAARSRFARSGVALPPMEVVGQGTLYRVYSGPFASRAAAEAAALELERSGALSPLIVQR